MVLGGIEVTSADIEKALACLRSAAGLMIRQPLARIGSPLARCRYHDVAAPWRERFSHEQAHGRGAAGRHIAKDAFCFALEQALTAASPELALEQLLGDAMDAFAADHTYAAAMARAAVNIAAKHHSVVLRAELRQAAHQAVSACDARKGEFLCTNPTPCGTGFCRFASGDLALITAISVHGRQIRPANHALGLPAYSSEDALAQLEQLRPFTVPIPVHDSDAGHVADVVVPSG